MGTRGTPEQRAREAACAAEIMGVNVRINLEFPDALIENTSGNRKRVVEAIRAYRPHLIITHDANNRNPDHTHTSMLVREAAFTAGLAKYDTGQEPHRPNKILYAMEYFEFTPSFYVDITDQFDRKMHAVSCYRSQTYNPENEGEPETYIASDKFIKEITAKFRYFGRRIHSEYGEVFRMDTPMEVDDVLAEVGLRGLIPGQGRGAEPL